MARLDLMKGVRPCLYCKHGSYHGHEDGIHKDSFLTPEPVPPFTGFLLFLYKYSMKHQPCPEACIFNYYTSNIER